MKIHKLGNLYIYSYAGLNVSERSAPEVDKPLVDTSGRKNKSKD